MSGPSPYPADNHQLIQVVTREQQAKKYNPDQQQKVPVERAHLNTLPNFL